MNIREFLNNNSAVATIVAVVILVIALGIIVWQNKGPSAGDYKSYYYDLNTKEIFVDSGTIATPHDNGNGTYNYFDGAKGSAVRAFIFTCNDPEDIKPGMTLAEIEAAGGFIAYLERMSPEMLAMQAKIDSGQELTAQDYETSYAGTLISNQEGQVWFPQETEQAMQLMESALTRCGAGQQARLCLP